MNFKEYHFVPRFAVGSRRAHLNIVPVRFGEAEVFLTHEEKIFRERKLVGFQLKAMGIKEPEVAERLAKIENAGIDKWRYGDSEKERYRDIVKRIHVDGLKESKSPSQMHLIVDMIKAGEIDRKSIETGIFDGEQVTRGLGFEKYNLLSEEKRNLFDYLGNSESWAKDQDEMAHERSIPPQTFKNKESEIYKILGVTNITAARVFFYLLKNPASAPVEGK